MAISQEELKRLLNYDPITGLFTWAVNGTGKGVGRSAGTLREDGYIRIQVNGDRRYASHWACLYMTGEFPRDEMDHEDRDRANNAWSNLRFATKSQNCANRPQQSRAGSLPRGVARRRKKFVAVIRVRAVTHYLGIFNTPEEAHAAYVERSLKEFGSFSVLAANDNVTFGEAA